MPITPDTFMPYGAFTETEDWDTIMTVTIDGVRYFTDRRLIIRADLVEPQPGTDRLLALTETMQAEVAKSVTALLSTTPADAPAEKLAPLYIADVESAGLALVPAAKFWLIQKNGITVGCISPTRGDVGMLPGEIRPEHRAAHALLSDYIEDRWVCWYAAVDVTEAVKAAA